MPEFSGQAGTYHYELKGEGPALFLVPGLLSDNASWGPIAEALAPRFTLVLPDPLGAGRTWSHAPFGAKAMATDFLALADELRLGPLRIVGHSFGGRVALEMARAAPDRMARVLALATGPEPSARSVSVFRTLLALRTADHSADVWLRALYPWLFSDGFFAQDGAVEAAIAASLAYPHAQSAANMAFQIDGYAQTGSAPAVPEGIDMRVLLAGGDALVPADGAARGWQARGARVDTLPGAGHALHWDQPDAVVRWIATALGS